jgi:hypothetical protein
MKTSLIIAWFSPDILHISYLWLTLPQTLSSLDDLILYPS